MPARSPELRRSLASAGAEARWGRLTQRQRDDLAVDRLEDRIRRAVQAAPPLTQEQRDRLALLLNSASSRGAAA